MNQLEAITLLDADEQPVPLATLWQDGPAALVFMRHYGCVHCRHHALELQRDRDQFPAGGDEITVIGMGTPAHARNFLKETGANLRILVSPDKAAYQAMDLTRGSLAQIFHPAAIRSGRKRAGGEGTGKASGGNLPLRIPEQDWHQLGGAFVIDAQGEIVWSHRAAHSGDNPDHTAMIAALRGAVATST